ncbi:MAG: hypothetical protein CMH57_14050 [Myxococcales bacterium]|nr:hypothetical protein [Myxococcales bacterium]
MNREQGRREPSRAPRRAARFTSWIAPCVVLGVALIATGCGRTGHDVHGEAVVQGDAGGVDASMSDLGGGGQDALPERDAPPATPDTAEGPPPAPPLPTPERSAEVDRLYCELDNGQLVRAALRAAACLDASLPGVLDDASRGFLYGEVMASGYAPVTLGNCDLLKCLDRVTDCAQAQACQDAVAGAACEDNYRFRCDGTRLVGCLPDRERVFRETVVQDCARQGAACEVFGEREAGCVGEPTEEPCPYYGTCAGDAIRRCTGARFGEGAATQVEIPCDELVADGICVETPVGGEAPGPACASPEQACTNGFAEGFECTGETTMSVCLYGSIIDIDCADYGYTSCAADGFFSIRCE